MDTVKEDLCLLNELLYALNGFYGHIYQLNSAHNFESLVGTFQIRFSNLDCYTLVKELLQLSQLYSQLNVFLVQNSTHLDEFRFIIYNLVTKAITQTYIADVVSFDYYNKLNNASAFKLNSLLKYKYFFTDILNIICDLSDENKCLALLKLSSLIEVKYDIKFNHENDPFFRGVWSWLTRGILPINHIGSFFISINSLGHYSLDISKFPDLIEPFNAIKIHNIGNLIRYIHLHGIQTNFQHSQLYWKYFHRRFEIYNSSILFKYFLNDVKKFVFENVLQVTKLKESFLVYLGHLKTFYLFGIECFWINFLDIYTGCDANSDIKILFRNAIFKTFDYSTADYYNNFINIKIDKQESSNLKLKFKQTPLMKIMISKNFLTKYQTIFNYLYKLNSTHYNLIAMWKNRILSPENFTKEWYLHHCLVRTFTTFYMYCKFSIEHSMSNYTRSIQNSIEIDEICKFHDNCLLDIINCLFIRNSYIMNLLNGLVEVSQNLNKSDKDVGLLFEKYTQIMTAFRSGFNLNRKHANMFNELLDSL